MIRRIIPLFFLAFAVACPAQFYKLHGGSISVGGTGQFSPQLTADNTNYAVYNVPFGNGTTTYPETVSDHQQYTTDSAGFVTSLQFHPVAWAGVEVNYGFTHYSERFTFNYSTVAALQSASVPTDAHEATAA